MEDIVTIALLAVLFVFIALDFAVPARTFPKVRFWRLKGIASFVMLLGISTAAPLLWTDLFAEHRLIDATRLGTVGGAIVGLLFAQFVAYWWHRAMHRTPVLWRWLHQMHHSAERVDIWGAFWFSPFDVLGFAAMGSLALVLVVGVSAEAAILVNFAMTFLSMFQHANIRTPRWLGYFIQRPEAHSVHHERGVHGHNYGDITVYDILFGTFKNPATWQGEAGFYDGASSRVGAMLLGRDVAEPAAKAREWVASGVHSETAQPSARVSLPGST